MGGPSTQQVRGVSIRGEDAGFYVAESRREGHQGHRRPKRTRESRALHADAAGRRGFCVLAQAERRHRVLVHLAVDLIWCARTVMFLVTRGGSGHSLKRRGPRTTDSAEPAPRARSGRAQPLATSHLRHLVASRRRACEVTVDDALEPLSGQSRHRSKGLSAPVVFFCVCLTSTGETGVLESIWVLLRTVTSTSSLFSTSHMGRN
jgi:hypothetical protein